jgi:ribosomal-protein-alanine N-acetyltransferase
MPLRTTPRLVLRPFIPADRERLITIASQPGVMDGTISVPDPFDATAADAWIADHADQPGYAVALNANPAVLIGYVGLHDVDTVHGQAELSFWIDEAHGGSGLATEAAAALLDHAFGDLGLNRICAFHMVRNTGSGRVLGKLGFTHEGVLRERVFKAGRFEDVNVWAVLRRDRP